MAQDSTINMKELEILKFWKKDKTFEKSLAKTKKGKPYIFYDGPPFATGLPHYGHLLASILKDLFPRYFTMKGRYVKRVWGWDCHGLPIENVVEKELGLNGKDEIEKIGVKKFNDACRNQVLAFAKDWETYIDRIGRWVDYEGGYKTMDTSYIESVWWAFKQLHEKGYLYEGEKVLMYCPRCSTPLAKSEIAMDNSYRKIKDTSVVVKFGSLDKEKTYFLAWTTTPWTLPSNLALAVHPNLNYAFIKDKKDGNTYILAKELVNNFYKDQNEYTVEKEVKGKELEGMAYEPLFDYFGDHLNSFKVILGDFVTVVEGTGIVHIAPAFGEDDNLVARKYNIKPVSPVDEKGRFTEIVKDYAFEFVHDASEKIAIDLKKNGKAIMSRKIEHEYPFCYRCDTKLIYRALPAWFVNIQKIKSKLLELNLNINWYPEFLKEGVMKNGISSAPDWNITRNRYWASAIPIWRSKSGKVKVLGSIEELEKYAVKLPKGKVDLHKDYLDDVELEIDGEKYKRIPEVLDCWFESGAMTFAQFHYPFENKKFFEKNFPAQYVVEYVAQTRTWFYYMIALSAILFDKIPFENVLTTGTILAEDGSKMSKSKGNYPDPLKVIEKYGADTLRFYLMQSPVVLAGDVEFSEKGLEEVYKKVMILISNVKNFFDLYKDLKSGSLSSKNILDKWIISRTNELIRDVSEFLEVYNPIKACASIKEFVEDLSTWYIRRSRDRFNEEDKNARAVLEYVLDNFSKVVAPIIPFMAENIYQTIYNKKSVHLEDWPKVDSKKIDEKLNSKMKMAREIVSIGMKERDRAGIPVKWPLSRATVYLKDNQVAELEEIIKDELNIKYLDLKVNSKSNEIKIELDTKITPELESEGMAREISRKIQAMRKNAGLVKEDKIILNLELNFDLRVDDQNFLKSRVGASKVIFGKVDKKFEFLEEGKIKDKAYKIGFKKI